MGSGSYTASDWAKLKDSKKLDTAGLNEIFNRRAMDDKYNPRYIGRREAHDSEEHPESTPIIIGVDTTGSMGYLAEQIVRESLNEVMQKLYSTKMLKDPQLLFAAIGDVCDNAPLQVTQFESDIRIAKQLTELWLEMCGGDTPEDYELAWYFAAKHTDIDSYKRRNKKGFCITIGDAPVHEEVSEAAITRIFGDVTDKTYYTSKELAELASEKYELLHIHIGDYLCNLSEMIPGRVLYIAKEDVTHLAEIIISAIQLLCGIDEEKILQQWSDVAKPIVKNAISTILLPEKGKLVL